MTFQELILEILSQNFGASMARYEAAVSKYLKAELSPKELRALESVYRMAGAKAAADWLDERFREPDDLVGVPGCFFPFRFVRIRRGSLCSLRVIQNTPFQKYVGWYKVPRSLGALCAAEKERIVGNGGQLLFEVAVEPPDVCIRVVERDE